MRFPGCTPRSAVTEPALGLMSNVTTAPCAAEVGTCSRLGMSEAVIAVACLLLAATAAHMPGVIGAITCTPLIAASEVENRALSGHEGNLTALTEC